MLNDDISKDDIYKTALYPFQARDVHYKKQSGRNSAGLSLVGIKREFGHGDPSRMSAVFASSPGFFHKIIGHLFC